jgi:hypothetical protein
MISDIRQREDRRSVTSDLFLVFTIVEGGENDRRHFGVCMVVPNA